MRQAQIKIIKQGQRSRHGVVLYATVRNEVYFVPHFLAHYRRLGVSEFCFLDDYSNDGTVDLLSQESDVTVLRANLRFGDMYGKLRFGVRSRTLVPRHLYSGRWVLTVDMDEFLEMPQLHQDLNGLTAALSIANLRCARAIMVDHYPDDLNHVSAASVDDFPLNVARNFDEFPELNWPTGHSAPLRIDMSQTIRKRMYQWVFENVIEARRLLPGYKLPNLNKVPLIRWDSTVEMLSAHRANIYVGDEVQLVLRHFKFYPGWLKKVSDAMETKAYWNDSIEYEMLNFCWQHLRGVDLRILGGFKSFDSGVFPSSLLYSRV